MRGFPLPPEATGGGGERMRAGTVLRGGWVTLNPFSRWSYKEWGLLKWVQTIDWLWTRFGIAAIIVGAPAERKRAVNWAIPAPERCTTWPERRRLQAAGVLQRSRLHIGVDSAAPHIAAAVGTSRSPSTTLRLAVLGAAGEAQPRCRPRDGVRPLQSEGMRGERRRPLPRRPAGGAGAGGHS